MTRFRFSPTGEKAHHARFYREAGIQGWREELALRSELTAGDYLRRLALFSATTGWSARKLLEESQSNPGAVRALLTEYATVMMARGRRPVYIRKHFDAIRSWIRRNGGKFEAFPPLSGRRGETLENERTPTQDELRKLLAALNPKGRVVALLMAHSGLRPGAIASIDGSDGLKLEDLEGLTLAPEPKFDRVPFAIRVRAVRSKNARSYLTFGSPELAESLIVLLRERLARGEKLTLESPVITSSGQGLGEAGGQVTTKSVVLPIRKAISVVRPGGERFRPYALRAFFSTQLLIAEARGTIVRDAREHFLGHDLGVSGRYHLSKRLGSETIEELRSMYSRSLPYITALGNPETSMDVTYRALLEFVGYDEAAIDSVGLLDAKKVGELVRRAKESAASASFPVSPGQQKVVDTTAVEAWIGKGWRFVAALNGSKVVLEAPQ